MRIRVYSYLYMDWDCDEQLFSDLSLCAQCDVTVVVPNMAEVNSDQTDVR